MTNQNSSPANSQVTQAATISGSGSDPDQNSTTAGKALLLPVWILAVYALGIWFAEASTVFLWIACAFFLFVVLDPTAQYLKARRWPTAWTALGLVLVATIAVGLLLFLVGNLSAGMAMELEDSKKLFMHYYSTMQQTWNSYMSHIPGLAPATGQGLPNAAKSIPKVEVVQNSPFGGEVGSTVLRGLGSAVTILTFSLLVPILAFFLLAERDSLAKVIKRAWTDGARATDAWAGIVRATRAFFLGNLVLALVSFPIFLVLFYFFGISSAMTLAILASIFNLIPFLGAVLSGFLPALTLVAQTEHVGAALILYAICALLHFAVANFVTPKVLGSKVNINATTSTIALIAWGELWGGVGLLLAIPLTATVKILFEHSGYFWLEWIAALMSEKVDGAIQSEAEKKAAAPSNATGLSAEPMNVKPKPAYQS